MLKLLIADNDRFVTDSIANMLAPYFKVDKAQSGIEVLQMADQENYDGLIIDVDFGAGVNGFEIMSILREKNRHIKILLFSAIELPDVLSQKLASLGAEFHTKPLTKDIVDSVFGVVRP